MMTKKTLITIFAAVLVASCGGEKKEHALDKLGLTIAITGDTKIECQENSSLYGPNCTFTVNNKRNMIRKIEASAFPANTDALEQAVKQEEGFEAVKDKKNLENGAFGIVWDKKNSKGETTQSFLFYYKKGENHFSINPVFHGDGNAFGPIIDAIGSLK